MFKRNFSFLLLPVLILFMAVTTSPVLAADEEALGRTAEQAGKTRQALNHYVAALQSTSEGSSKDQQLREKIIKLAQKIQPPPALPEEAHRHMARGEAFVGTARDKNGFLRAAGEFQATALAAPWLADAYYNLGIVQDKAGLYQQATRNLKLYLLAAPNASDARTVRNLIYKIEARQEEAQRVKVEEKRKKSLNPQDLVGSWSYIPRKFHDDPHPQKMFIKAGGNNVIFSGKKLLITNTIVSTDQQEIQLKLQGYELKGVMRVNKHGVVDAVCWRRNPNYFKKPLYTEVSVTGTVSKDKNKITLRFKEAFVDKNINCGISYRDAELTFTR